MQDHTAESRNPQGLFREEALRYHLAARAEGDVLRLPPAWIRRTDAFLLFSIVTGLLLLWFVPVKGLVEGPAVVGSRDSVAAFLPARAASSLRPGQRMLLREPGDHGAPVALRIRQIGSENLDPAEVLRRVPSASVAGIALTEPMVEVSAEVGQPAGAAAFREGSVWRAEVVLPSERLLYALLPALRRSTKES